MSNLKIKDIMTCDPFIISPEKTVEDAAKLMKDIDCGVLPVGANPEKVVGMITDRDITLRVTAEGKDASQTRIKEVMTKRVHTCDAETTVEDAAKQMRSHDVCRLVVMKGDHATGIVTLAELLRNTHDLRTSDKVLHELLGASKQRRAKKAKMETADAGCESCE